MKKAIEVLQARVWSLAGRTRHNGPAGQNGTVDYYGTQTPVNQVANLAVPEPRTIVIQPWDKKIASCDRKGDFKIGPWPDA